jgi:RNA polymerase sigma-70 factor (ECF subfamily)
VTDEERLAIFQAERPHLVGLLYRLLGRLSEAEDVVQEVWLRWAAADADVIERPGAWLTTVASRAGLDRLRRDQRERVTYVGPWLPEPFVTPADAIDPSRAVELADSLTTAFLLVLERLDPVERLVVLLVDVFGEPFAEVSRIVGRSEAACRQLASRARRRLRAEPHLPAQRPDAATVDLANRFADAALAGDEDAVRALLHPDVVVLSDGGATTQAARKPVVGPQRAARLLVNLARRLPPGSAFSPAWVNGQPGIVVRLGGQVILVLATEWADGLLLRFTAVVNPEKLTLVEAPPTLV